MGVKGSLHGAHELLLILALLLLPSSLNWISRAAATLEQGAALQEALGSKWIRKPLPTWIAGTDPCSAKWERVVCDTTGNIISLNLTHTGLQGPVPAALGRLSSLRTLDLGNNNACADCGSWNAVTGDLDAISDLVNLETLILTANELSLDHFPRAILNLIALVNLRLDSALIRGTIPAEIGSLQNLAYLYLGNNSFTSPVPWEKISTIVGLRHLSIWGNYFVCECPPELKHLVRLTYLNMNQCGFYGGLPPEYGQLIELERLLLFRNNLTGPIPDSWVSMSNLIDFDLQNNFLYGKFPSWLLRSPSLVVLQMTNNLFYGPMLRNLNETNTPRLQKLSLECNYISGTRPLVSPNITAYLDYNCFDNETSVDSNCVRPQNCLMFQSATRNGKTCPNCPFVQHLVNAATCVCFLDSEVRKKNVKLIIALSTSITSGAVLILFVILLFVIKKLRRQTAILKDIQKEFAKRDVKPYLYSYFELKVATQDFNPNQELGSGGYGVVYKGVLSDNSIVAIKRLKMKTDQALQDFLNEIVTISSIKHRNLVQLKGCCIKGEERFLIYEYVDNKNLAEALWDCPSYERLKLDWPSRFNIIVGVARGLLYLHEDVQPTIIHRDIKPPNILLDKNLNAKIADFGLALLFPELLDDQTHQSISKVAGTRGYLAPEYASFGQVSTKVDIFSYGILILEIVSGRKNIDFKMPVNQHYLFDWAKSLHEANQLHELIDVTILDSATTEVAIKRVLHVALLCISYTHAKRPVISEVLNMLLNNIEVPNISCSSRSDCSEKPWTDDSISMDYFQAILEERDSSLLEGNTDGSFEFHKK